MIIVQKQQGIMKMTIIQTNNMGVEIIIIFVQVHIHTRMYISYLPF